MVAFYVNRIHKGLITIDKVPRLWRAKVEAALAAETTEA